MKENSFTLKKTSRWYPVENITDADDADDLALLGKTPAQTDSLHHNLEQSAGVTGLCVNSDRMLYSHIIHMHAETYSTQ